MDLEGNRGNTEITTTKLDSRRIREDSKECGKKATWQTERRRQARKTGVRRMKSQQEIERRSENSIVT